MSSVIEAGRNWEYSAFPVRVAAVQRISPGFVRITLAGPSLIHFAAWGLDQRIKLVLPMPDGTRPEFGLLDEPTPHPQEWYTRWKQLPVERRNVLRTYTPSAIRPERAEIDVDVYVHQPAGPASAWALSCAVGDELVLTGPDARVGYTGYGIHYTPSRPPSRVVLIGDESALPAINNVVRQRGDDERFEVFLELGDPADDILVPFRDGDHAEIVRRRGVGGEALEEAITRWDGAEEIAADPGAYVWIAGETGAAARMRRHLTTTIGIDKERVAFLGYWKHGGPLVS